MSLGCTDCASHFGHAERIPEHDSNAEARSGPETGHSFMPAGTMSIPLARAAVRQGLCSSKIGFWHVACVISDVRRRVRIR